MANPGCSEPKKIPLKETTQNRGTQPQPKDAHRRLKETTGKPPPLLRMFYDYRFCEQSHALLFPKKTG